LNLEKWLKWIDTEIRPAVHQKMKGVENALGIIGVEVVIQIVKLLHLMIIGTCPVQGLKGERREALGKRVAAENTRSIISMREGTLSADLIVALRKNEEMPRGRNEGREVGKDLNFSYILVPNLRYWHERNWIAESSPNPGPQSTKILLPGH
jgi:hypothetical protein